jgi:hypothetical protein
MFKTAQIEIPGSVAARLREAAAFSDNVYDYARENLIGFNRPLAAAFAVLAPVVLAFVYLASGPLEALKIAFLIALIVMGGVYLVGKAEWANIVATFQEQTREKHKAVADLRCGFGESSFLSNGRSPRFYDHEYGVIVLADAGDLKTLFFDISNQGGDKRWELYKIGELHRRVWRWTRLPVSREVVKFATEGSKLVSEEKTRTIKSIDAWEAFNVALGEPLDGALIHQPFETLTEQVERLVR